MSQVQSLTGEYSDSPVPFDVRYATAAVGETLRFVDWYTAAPTGPDAPPQPICSQPAGAVPSFEAKVVAAAGSVAVVIDLRHPAAAYYTGNANLGWLQEAVTMTDRLLLPTMRSIFDPDYEGPAGGGGRFYIMLGNIAAGGFAYDGTLPAVTVAPQSLCPRASEMVVSTVGAAWLASPQNQAPPRVAGLFLHEYAHNADLFTSRRGRTQSILNEGLASLAEETASRIASGQPLNARHSVVGTDAPLLTGPALGMWGTQPEMGTSSSTAAMAPMRACSCSCASLQARHRPITRAGPRCTSDSSLRRSTGSTARRCSATSRRSSTSRTQT